MKREDRLVNVIAAIIVRVLYFAGGFAVSFYLMFRMWIRHSDPYEPNFRPLIVAPLVIGTLTGLVGPHLYRQSAHRGRGSLKQIRALSEQRKREGPEEERREPWN